MLKLLLGDPNTRKLKRYQPLVEEINLLEEEVLSANKKTGKSFDVNEAIASQYSFFACYNNIASRDVKNDLNRYLYNKEFGTSAYKGSYGEQPCLWVEKVFLYKNILW